MPPPADVGVRVQFARADRAWLAALVHPPRRGVLDHLQLLVRPETVLRWLAEQA